MNLRVWARDLTLGARFAVTGGRPGLLRTVLTAAGVGFGTALLLLASSLPNMLFQREVRDSSREVDASRTVEEPGPGTFLHYTQRSSYRGASFTGLLLKPEDAKPAVPPGTDGVPAAGEMLVSPALAELLAAPGNTLLRERIPYKNAGTIGEAGLIGPNELRYVANAPFLTDDNAEGRGVRYGWSVPEEPMNAFLILLVVIAYVVLLLPVLVFIATAARFGGEQRDRRLAALRLVGADNATTRRIAAGESLAGALLGLLTGAALFLVARQFAGAVQIWDVNAYPADVVPNLPLALLVLAVVPVSSVVVTLLALRGVAIEPLGVIRSSTPGRRRVWWRLLLLVAGAALLVPTIGDIQMGDTAIDTVTIGGGTVLFLVGLTSLLPWLVEAAVKRLRGGPVSWQLAVRRLQLSSGTAARAVSGIVVAATGAIALQMLFQAMEHDFTSPTGQDSSRAQIQTTLKVKDGAEARQAVERLRAVDGVTHVIATTESYVYRDGPVRKDEDFAPLTQFAVGDCASLREYAVLSSCADGDVFMVLPPKGVEGLQSPDLITRVARPGADVALRDPAVHKGAMPRWRVPAGTRTAEARLDPSGQYRLGVFATPASVDVTLLDSPDTRLMVGLDPAAADAPELVRNAALAIDPTAVVNGLSDTEQSSRFLSVRTGIYVGSTLTMLLVAASLLVTTLEQLRDRKRLLSSLVAFGTRRTTLSWSVLWQTAVPIFLGLALSVVGGLALGMALLAMTGQGTQDWWAFLPVVGIGLGLIAVVTLFSLPMLWRLMRADGLRTE
ncbi:FtsX-like permease family protein [Streptomyces termitum]|uniref:Membrane protein n=1 Tax=Streptomyces termitum TaxID=67368 RepID=A0A918SXI4_9ACTN|nr:FtsX-like permease family protein [Streptomyces termitum]GHA72120.1 membrane protein [Streptomyces termitum]